MAEYYTKECPFEGSQEPVKWTNGLLHSSIPQKCKGCKYFHEMKCKKVTNRLLRLDYGYCGIEGSKALVSDERVFRKIPEKCSGCRFLKEDSRYKLVCGKDPGIWRDFPRGLDY